MCFGKASAYCDETYTLAKRRVLCHTLVVALSSKEEVCTSDGFVVAHLGLLEARRAKEKKIASHAARKRDKHGHPKDTFADPTNFWPTMANLRHSDNILINHLDLRQRDSIFREQGFPPLKISLHTRLDAEVEVILLGYGATNDADVASLTASLKRIQGQGSSIQDGFLD